MSPDLKKSSLGLAPLLNGIVEDAQTLIRQELSLFQSEVKEDLGRTRTAAIPLVLGMAASLLAGFFLGTALVRWMMLQWPELPDFAAYGLVGGVLAFFGTMLVVAGLMLVNNNPKGKQEFVDATRAHPKQSPNPSKEKTPWKTQI